MKILVVQGAGMNMRGKTQTEIFGTMTWTNTTSTFSPVCGRTGYRRSKSSTRISKVRSSTGCTQANDQGFDGALVNPAGFSRGYPALTAAISQVKFPVIEVHISNPVRRGPVSDTAQVSLGMVTGFGVLGYYLAMRGLRDTRKEPRPILPWATFGQASRTVTGGSGGNATSPRPARSARSAG